jgi:glycosyltransferase involved in cell wall biosynthesis
MDVTLRDALRQQDNDCTAEVAAYERHHQRSWRDPVPVDGDAAGLSVVIPARDNAYCLPSVLDAVARTAVPVEVIVIDDASTDATAMIACRHPSQPTVIRLPSRQGAGSARNVGVAVASSATVCFLDADMVAPPEAFAEHAMRAADGLIGLGLRHNITFHPLPARLAEVLAGRPDLERDHRVRWEAPAGPLLYSGRALEQPVHARPLDATDDLRLLGNGRWFYDWDLPRMVVTAMLSVRRDAVAAVGGFEPSFGQGWGCDDTFLGARLISAGHKVVPLRHAVGFHIDPPDAAAAWQAKLRLWPGNIARYWRLLDQPAARDAAAGFARETNRLLRASELLS